MTIELRDVTMENYFDVLNLDVKEYQKTIYCYQRN